MLSFRERVKFDQSACVVILTKEQVEQKFCSFSSKKICQVLEEAVEVSRFEGNKGEMFPVVAEGKVILLAGLGKTAHVTGTSLRIAIRQALLAVPLRRVGSVEVVLHDDTEDNVRAAVEAVVMGCYAWRKYITPPKDDKTVYEKDVALVTSHAAAGAQAVIIAKAVNAARDLVNDNADTVTPEYLADTVSELVKGNKHVSLEVLGRKELEANKFGLLLAVNQGSNKKPRVVIARYTGAGKNEPYTAIVGKGLTFDCGGLNLKPTGSMEDMRQDMSGAAAVIGTLQAVLALELKKNIIFAFGSVENAIDANSYKPGDVFVSYSGKTVEIGNTDAEGRLVLADVLSYVIKTYKPAQTIDLATLTGACRVALAEDHAAILGTDEKLIADLVKSARATDDRIWQLPLYPEIRDVMKSKIADLKNTSSLRGAGGTITGAEFLRHFTENTPWAHLDIANVAFVEGDSRWYYAHGATGFGVRLLVRYLLA